MARRTTAQTRQRRARLERKGREPVEEEYSHDAREAAQAIDGKAIRARGEVPPWEEEQENEGPG